MGATNFRVVSRIKDGESWDDVFKREVETAKFECGHGGYTGSIAEKNSFVHLKHCRTMEEAIDEAIRLLDHPQVVDKWGPAGAVTFKKKLENPEVIADYIIFFGFASC